MHKVTHSGSPRGEHRKHPKLFSSDVIHAPQHHSDPFQQFILTQATHPEDAPMQQQQFADGASDTARHKHSPIAGCPVASDPPRSLRNSHIALTQGCLLLFVWCC